MIQLYNYELRFVEQCDAIITSGGLSQSSRQRQRNRYAELVCQNLTEFFVENLNHNPDSICLTYIIKNISGGPYLSDGLCWLQTENELLYKEFSLLKNKFHTLVGFKSFFSN